MTDAQLGAVQRALLIAAPIATALFVWLPSRDSFAAPKLMLILLIAGAVVLLAMVRVGMSARIMWPRVAAALAMVAFLCAVLLATVTSDAVLTSAWGQPGRMSGALLHLCVGVLFLYGLRTLHVENLSRFVAVVSAGALVVAAVALLQWAGINPGGFQRSYAGAFSTLGNPNFASGWLGIALPVGAWLLVRERSAIVLRLAAVALLMVLVFGIVSTRSLQGYAAAGAGVFVVALAWLLERPKRTRFAGISVLVVVTAAIGVTALRGILGAGPLAFLRQEATLQQRMWYWDSAMAMFRDHPVLGVGLDQYVAFYRSYRPAAVSQILGVTSEADAAHSVPLQLLSGGGLILGLAYLVLIIAVGAGVVRGLLRQTGDRRLLVGALGGGWAGYLVQSFVSIDVPSLPVFGWTLAAAALVAAGDVPLREVSLPWKAVVGGARKRQNARTNRRKMLLATTATGLWLVLAWAATLPVRASSAVKHAHAAAEANALPEAVEFAARAVDLTPWDSGAWFEYGRILVAASKHQDALDAFEQASRRAPRDLASVITAARLADHLGLADHAKDLYDRAVILESRAPDVLIEAAIFHQEAGRAAEARRLAERVLEQRPDDPRATEILNGTAAP